MDSSVLKISQNDGILEIFVNRPKKLNSYTSEVYEDFAKCLHWANGQPDVRVVLFSAVGSYFSAGNDLENFRSGTRDGGDRLRHFLDALLCCRKPLVAAVNGPAVGIGVTVLGLFDFVFCAKSATFHTPFAALALSPEGGSSLLMPLQMGRLAAHRMLLLGDSIGAEEALRLGWVTAVFAEQGDAFAARCRQEARRLAALAPTGLQESKQLLKEVWAPKLREAIEREIELLNRRIASGEPKAAVSKILEEKRKKKSKL